MSFPSSTNQTSPSFQRGRAGLSLIENVVAMGIVAVLFTGLFSLSSHCLTLTSAGREAALASLALTERMATLRECTWAQLTSANYLQSSVLNSATNSASQLSTPVETITVNTYSTALTPAISVVRSSTGVASVSTTNNSIANGNMARVDIALSWKGSSGRSRTQSTVTIVARVDP